MPSCVVKSCKINSNHENKSQGITFHRFPAKNDVWKQDWIDIIRKCRNDDNWNPSKYSVVCSKHFDETCFYKTKRERIHIIEYSVPTKFLFDSTNSQENVPAVINNSSGSLGNSSVVESATASGSGVQIDLGPCSSQTQAVFLQPSSSVVESATALGSGLVAIKLKPCASQASAVFLQPSAFVVGSATASGSGVQIKSEPCSSQNHTFPLQADATRENSPIPDVHIEQPMSVPICRKTVMMKSELKKLRSLVLTQKKKIKILNQKVRRLQVRNISLKNILKTVKQRNDPDLLNSLNENFEPVDLSSKHNRKNNNKKVKRP